MTEDELYSHLIAWLRHRSGLQTIIRDHIGKPRPSGEYGMVNLIRSRKLHDLPSNHEYINIPTSVDEPVIQIPVMDWEWAFSFNVYATGATDFARKIITAGSTQAGMESLGPLSLNRVSEMRRIPELVGGVWEDRAQLDLFIHGRARDGLPIYVIEKATIRVFHNDDTEPKASGSVAKPVP